MACDLQQRPGLNSLGRSDRLFLESTTARASPSIGAYLDSAPVVKRLPTRVTFQCDLPHSGVMSLHVQCFCSSQNPSPSLHQSVARHVGFDLSNIWTPSRISSSAHCASPISSLRSFVPPCGCTAELGVFPNGCGENFCVGNFILFLVYRQRLKISF